MTPRHDPVAWLRIPSRSLAAWCAVTLVAAAPASADESAARRPVPPAARSRTIVDHAVEPAGGAICRQCGHGHCPLHRGHLAECQDGLCAPHCPVRPSQYGYYKTQWRRWPGQGVVPASAEEAATPAAPPKSQVPSAEEESPRLPEDEASSDTAAPGDEPAREPRPNDALPTDPIPDRGGADAPILPDDGAAVAPAPAASDRVAPLPPGEPPMPAESTEDDALFDEPATPKAAAPAPIDQGALRYPAQAGRALATFAAPRGGPMPRQRPAGSVRGL